MMELYKLIPYEQMKDGDPVLAFGVHVLRWDFEQMGQPKYAFVPVDFDIDGLRARIAELEAANRWIPVGERMPEPGKKVLVLYDGACVEQEPAVAAFCGQGLWSIGYNQYLDRVYDCVTHWRPLPEPPEA